MNTQRRQNEINIQKISVCITIFGVLFIVIGVLLLFVPIITGYTISNGTIEASIGKNWLGVLILTLGGILNILSYKLSYE